MIEIYNFFKKWAKKINKEGWVVIGKEQYGVCSNVKKGISGESILL